jgi:hypothetical protein
MTHAGNWAGIPIFFSLSHHFHDWATGLWSYALYAHVRGSMGDQSTVSGMSYYICSPHQGGQSQWFCSVGSNWEPHGQQPIAYTHQTTVVVIISVQICLYIPLNMWKYQRNWNLKFQKIDPLRNRTQVIKIW